MPRNNVTIKRHYDGADVWLRCVFYDRDYEEADPASVVITITEPDGVETVKGLGDMEQWSDIDGDGLAVQVGHWQYKHTNSQTGFHKFLAEFVMANGDSGAEIGRWKVV